MTSVDQRLSSSSALPADLIAPRYLSIPDEFDSERTLGPEVAAIATLAGFPPDPEQQLLLDVSFALAKSGKPLIFDTVLIAPRQNLKTGYLKQRALGKLFVQQRPLVVWSAHEFDTSRRALLDLESMIDGSDVLRRRVKLTSRGTVATHGAVPEITLLPKFGGSTLAFKTRTSGGGRGLTGDDLFVDEAFAAQAAQMGAVMPIMLARPDSQVDFASSACRPESAYLWDLIQTGRKGAGGRTLYAEWCTAPPEQACDDGEACTHARDRAGCGCDKPEVIRLAHSAIARGRISLEKVTDLRRTIPAEEYCREIMGWHDTPLGGISVIDPEEWAERRDPQSKITGAVAIALDVPPGSPTASIAVYGLRKDGLGHGELVEPSPTLNRVGTAWVVDRLVDIAKRQKPCVLVLDPSSPAGAFIEELKDRGFVIAGTDDVVPGDKWRLMPVTGRVYAQACGALTNDIRDNRFRHLGQAPLNAAVDGARTAAAGDAYRWSRKDSTVDISPLVAVTLARHGFATFGRGNPAPFVLIGR